MLGLATTKTEKRSHKWMLDGQQRSSEARPTVVALAVALESVAVAPQPLRALVIGLSLLALLCWLAAIDVQEQRIPDAFTGSIAALGTASAYWLGSPEIIDAAIGTAAGAGFGIAVAQTYRRMRGRSGLGGGDIKLLAASGVWVGWQGIFVVILASSISALVIALLRRRISMTERIAFGPYLAMGLGMVWTALTLIRD
jgi:leader peptidase (prepilin peptidase)/N-methyltransferase